MRKALKINCQLLGNVLHPRNEKGSWRNQPHISTTDALNFRSPHSFLCKQKTHKNQITRAYRTQSFTINDEAATRNKRNDGKKDLKFTFYHYEIIFRFFLRLRISHSHFILGMARNVGNRVSFSVVDSTPQSASSAVDLNRLRYLGDGREHTTQPLRVLFTRRLKH